MTAKSHGGGGMGTGYEVKGGTAQSVTDKFHQPHRFPVSFSGKSASSPFLGHLRGQRGRVTWLSPTPISSVFHRVHGISAHMQQTRF